jgi:hypothetical protein
MVGKQFDLYLKRKVLKTKERNNKTIEIENPKGF